jgi:protein tyrosine/serine phosphatase
MSPSHDPDAADPKDRRRARKRRLLLVAASLVTLLAAAAVTILLSQRRPRPVIPGEILRSPQPSVGDLRRWARDHELRTVISLRGDGPQHLWLSDERALCAEIGIAHAALSFNPDDWPARHQLRRLITLLEEAERPILLHCLRGVDRTGWAAAVVRLLDGGTLDQALEQLSPTRGHICDRASCPLHRFFDQYRRHLEATGIESSAAAFRRWATEDYSPDPYHAELELEGPQPSSLTAGEPLTLAVRVTNRGRDRWLMSAEPGRGVRLGARVIGPFDVPPNDPIRIFRTPHAPAQDLGRAGLEEGEIPAGGQRRFELRIRAPDEIGRYVLQIDMVNELVHWFSDLGGPGILLDIEVVPAE